MVKPVDMKQYIADSVAYTVEFLVFHLQGGHKSYDFQWHILMRDGKQKSDCYSYYPQDREGDSFQEADAWRKAFAEATGIDAKWGERYYKSDPLRRDYNEVRRKNKEMALQNNIPRKSRREE